MASVSMKQAAKYFRKVAQRLPVEIAKAEQVNARDIQRVLVRLSTGHSIPVPGLTWVYPYAAKNPRPPRGRADIINIRTGLFASSWRIEGPVSTFDGTMWTRIVDTAPYAGFMWGTSRMIARPIIATATQRTTPRRLQRLDDAINRAFRR